MNGATRSEIFPILKLAFVERDKGTKTQGYTVENSFRKKTFKTHPINRQLLNEDNQLLNYLLINRQLSTYHLLNPFEILLKRL